ncbi:MAG: hypothetical protein EOO61_14105, partial [Hymenobacter sp.]
MLPKLRVASSSLVSRSLINSYLDINLSGCFAFQLHKYFLPVARNMYLVDKQLKKLTPVPAVTFAEQGLKERQDLQEWLAAYPEA